MSEIDLSKFEERFQILEFELNHVKELIQEKTKEIKILKENHEATEGFFKSNHIEMKKLLLKLTDEQLNMHQSLNKLQSTNHKPLNNTPAQIQVFLLVILIISQIVLLNKI